MKIKCILFTVLIIFLNQPLFAGKGMKVMAIGHSLVNHDLPYCLDHLAKNAKKKGHVTDQQVTNGAPLKWNWLHPDKAEGVNGKISLSKKKYDMLILTTASPIQQHIKWSKPEKYGELFSKIALKKSKSCQIYFYLTWPTHEAKEWKQKGWLSELKEDRKQLEGLAKNLQKKLKARKKVKIIPASLAILKLKESINKGKVSGLKSINDIFKDEIHMNNVGNYFIACVWYSSIYAKSSEGLSSIIPGRYGEAFIDIPKKQATALQKIAWENYKEYKQP